MYREPYVASRYIEYAEQLRNKAKELGEDWTANKICDALFSQAKADQLGMLGEKVTVKVKNEGEERPTKKQRR